MSDRHPGVDGPQEHAQQELCVAPGPSLGSTAKSSSLLGDKRAAT